MMLVFRVKCVRCPVLPAHFCRVRYSTVTLAHVPLRGVLDTLLQIRLQGCDPRDATEKARITVAPVASDRHQFSRNLQILIAANSNGCSTAHDPLETRHRVLSLPSCGSLISQRFLFTIPRILGKLDQKQTAYPQNSGSTVASSREQNPFFVHRVTPDIWSTGCPGHCADQKLPTTSPPSFDPIAPHTP